MEGTVKYCGPASPGLNVNTCVLCAKSCGGYAHPPAVSYVDTVTVTTFPLTALKETGYENVAPSQPSDASPIWAVGSGSTPAPPSLILPVPLAVPMLTFCGLESVMIRVSWF